MPITGNENGNAMKMNWPKLPSCPAVLACLGGAFLILSSEDGSGTAGHLASVPAPVQFPILDFSAAQSRPVQPRSPIFPILDLEFARNANADPGRFSRLPRRRTMAIRAGT